MSNRSFIILTLLVLILLLISGFLTHLLFKLNSNSAQLNQNYKALKAESKIYRLKNGTLISENKALRGTVTDLKNQKDLLQLENDSLTKRLLKVVNKNTIAAVSFDSNIKIEKVVETKIDTFNIDNTVYDRTASFSDDWIQITANSNKDSTTFKATVRQKNDVVLEEKNTGFLGLGRPETVVKVIAKNPYTDSLSVRSYHKVESKPKNRVLWVGVGAGLMIILKVVTGSIL